MMEGNLKHVDMFTDGACVGNPGPGGFGVILKHGGHYKELSGGFRLTTNNRMEIFAAIAGLEILKEKCQVTVYSDSEYVVKAVMQGWAKKWRANGWRRTSSAMAVNPDLWGRLLDLCACHEVEFRWVRGHAGHPENERCDQLATESARRSDLPVDEGYSGGG